MTRNSAGISCADTEAAAIASGAGQRAGRRSQGEDWQAVERLALGEAVFGGPGACVRCGHGQIWHQPKSPGYGHCQRCGCRRWTGKHTAPPEAGGTRPACRSRLTRPPSGDQLALFGPGAAVDRDCAPPPVAPGLRVQCLPGALPAGYGQPLAEVVRIGAKNVTVRVLYDGRQRRIPPHLLKICAHPGRAVSIPFGGRGPFGRSAWVPGPGWAWLTWTLAEHLRGDLDPAVDLAPGSVLPSATDVDPEHAEAASKLRVASPPEAGAQVPLLVVIACGARKADRPAPAGQLYTGAYHRACRRAAEALLAAAGAGQVLILSARHGLLRPEQVTDPYDLRLGQPGAVTPRTLALQAHAGGWDQRRYPRQIVLGGRAYSELAASVWPGITRPLAGATSLGDHHRRLAALTRDPAGFLQRPTTAARTARGSRAASTYPPQQVSCAAAPDVRCGQQIALIEPAAPAVPAGTAAPMTTVTAGRRSARSGPSRPPHTSLVRRTPVAVP